LYVLLNNFHEIAVVVVHAMKAFGGGVVEVSGELHALAALFPEEPHLPFLLSLGGPQS